MQGKQTKVKNFPSEERKQSKNHCSPVKFDSKKKKNDKKIIDPGWDQAGKLPAIVQEEPRPIQYLVSGILMKNENIYLKVDKDQDI